MKEPKYNINDRVFITTINKSSKDLGLYTIYCVIIQKITITEKGITYDFTCDRSNFSRKESEIFPNIEEAQKEVIKQIAIKRLRNAEEDEDGEEDGEEAEYIKNHKRKIKRRQRRPWYR